MPPREPAIYNAGIGARAGVPVFVEDNTIIKGRTPGMHSRIRARINVSRRGDGLVGAAGDIPWRTSRRLQEATFRSIQERDGGHTQNHVSVEGDSPNITPLPARFPNRLHCSSQLKEEEEDDEGQEVPVEDSEDGAQLDEPLPVVNANSTCLRIRRKRKRRNEQFRGPLHLVRLDDSSRTVGGSSTSSSTSSNVDDTQSHKVATKGNSRVSAAVKKAEPTVSSGIAHIKQPQSCFDLLCSHIGLRGWKCYRYCITGQSFCIYHQTQNPTYRWNPLGMS